MRKVAKGLHKSKRRTIRLTIDEDKRLSDIAWQANVKVSDIIRMVLQVGLKHLSDN